MKKFVLYIFLILTSFNMNACLSKKVITVNAQDMTYEYDGEHAIFVYEVLESINLQVLYYSLSTNKYLVHPPVDIGDYIVELKYEGDEIYESFHEKYNLSIIKPAYKIDAKNMVLPYTGNKIPFFFNDSNVDYDIYYSKLNQNDFSKDIPTEKGNYKVKIITKENDSYRASEKEFFYTITSSNQYNLDNQEYTYTGDVISFEYEEKDNLIIKYFKDNKEVNEAIDAGTYDVLLIENSDIIIYCYYTLTINKSKVSIFGVDSKFSYTGEEIPFVANLSINDELSYFYSLENENNFSEDIPTNVGTYDVKVVFNGNTNYESCEKMFKLEILPKDEIIYEDSNIDYTENTEFFTNPEKGFYQALSHKLSTNTTKAIWSKNAINDYCVKYNLFHLRFGLEAFSSNAGGVDMDIPIETLNALKDTLQIFRELNATVIIRFSYNVNGVTINQKYLEAEPSLALVLKHVEQLATVINQFPDVICSVETGMLGPWGEQHSTTLGSDSISNANTYYELVEKWLNSLDSKFNISVRRPLYFIYWANKKYNLSLDTSSIGNFDFSTINDNSLYRVGCFNDGYLGSASDLGTYSNRTSEINWLNKQATHVLFGGEVVADDDTDGIGNFNSVKYLEVEAYKTHTSYLNYGWNYDRVISIWEKTLYSGTNSTYNNNYSTDFVFVNNHLGYNFVLKESKLNKTFDNGLLFLKGKIENNGFGNITRPKKVEIILSNNNNTYYYTVEMDVTKILSKTIYEYDFKINVNNIAKGSYNIYLKISDVNELSVSNLRTIRFANKSIYWNYDLGANYLGNFTY